MNTPRNPSRMDLAIEAVMDLDPSTVIDLACAACDVRADLASDTEGGSGAWDAWKSLATKLAELRARAAHLEKKSPDADHT